MRSRLKYGNKITILDGYKFHSAGEAKRWQELTLLENAGEIYGLTRQVKHDLFSNCKKVGTYTSDFEYYERKNNNPKTLVIEDFKGVMTALFLLKWKILQSMDIAGPNDIIFRITGKASNYRCGSLRGTSASKKKAKKAKKG